MRLLACLLIVVLHRSWAEEPHPPSGNGLSERADVPMPSDLLTTLTVPRDPIVISSSWVLQYVIHNRLGSPFSYETGGDYRGPRPTRVHLEAISADGETATDPLAVEAAFSMGGIAGRIPVPPYATSSITVAPLRYLRLDRPGRWTLRMYHDLGMGASQGDHDPRWASVTITLVMPDAAQARAVLAQQERLIQLDLDDRRQHRSRTAGEPWHAEPDFSALCVPVYLPLLMERERAGSRLAIAGLAAMTTAEAIDALLDLLERPPVPTPQPELDYQPEQHPWTLALQGLARRFAPPSAERRYLGSGDPGLMATMDATRRTRVQAVAMRLLGDADETVRRAAGEVVARAADDPATLLAAIDKASAEPIGTTALRTLLAAYRSSQAPVPDPSTSAAAAMVWLDRLQADPAARTGAWKDTLATLLKHPRARIREWSLTILPRDEQERWCPALMVALHDDDAQVRTRAIYACSAFKDQALLPHLQAAMVRADEPSFVGPVINQVGGPCAEIAAWIEVVEHSTIRFATSNGAMCLFRLINHLELRNHWPLETEPSAAMRHDFAQHLRAFLVANHDAIEHGTMSMPGKDWPADLLPEGWFFMFRDRSTWPPGNHL